MYFGVVPVADQCEVGNVSATTIAEELHMMGLTTRGRYRAPGHHAPTVARDQSPALCPTGRTNVPPQVQNGPAAGEESNLKQRITGELGQQSFADRLTVGRLGKSDPDAIATLRRSGAGRLTASARSGRCGWWPGK